MKVLIRTFIIFKVHDKGQNKGFFKKEKRMGKKISKQKTYLLKINTVKENFKNKKTVWRGAKTDQKKGL